MTEPFPSEPIDWEEEEDRIAPRYLEAGDPTGWFEELYAAGASGRTTMPFDRYQPHPLLAQWAQTRRLDGSCRRAIVVGCGLGADAEYIARLGFDTTAFDISETAIEIARQRHPDSPVAYLAADLLNTPHEWIRAFDLVIEIITVQALPDPPRQQAIANISRLVADQGTLLVIAAIHDENRSEPPPPWPLRRDEVEAFATDALSLVTLETAAMPGTLDSKRWRAQFHRNEPPPKYC